MTEEEENKRMVHLSTFILYILLFINLYFLFYGKLKEFSRWHSSQQMRNCWIGMVK